MRLQRGLLAGSTALGLLIGGAGLASAADAPKVAERTPVYACQSTGFWELPGTDICFKVGGYAKADFAYNSEDIITENVFNEALISTTGVVPLDKDRVKFASTESRINFDARSFTEYGTVRAFIEAHFFTGNDNSGIEAFSGGPGLGLRHAYVQIGNLLLGRFWSLYNDFQMYYESSNFTGPQAQTFNRLTQARWTQQVGNGVSIAVALENPESFTRGAGGLNVIHDGSEEYLPNAILQVSIQQSWGGVTLSGAAREVVLRNTLTGASEDEFGYGVQGTFKIKLPFGNGKSNINGGAQYSDGNALYHSFAKNTTADGFARAGQGVELFESWGAALGGQFWLNDTVRINAWGSYNEIIDDDLSGADIAFLASRAVPVGRESWRLGGNVVWSPVPRLDLFLEANWGELEDFAGRDNDAYRINFSAQRTF